MKFAKFINLRPKIKNLFASNYRKLLFYLYYEGTGVAVDIIKEILIFMSSPRFHIITKFLYNK